MVSGVLRYAVSSIRIRNHRFALVCIAGDDSRVLQDLGNCRRALSSVLALGKLRVSLELLDNGSEPLILYVYTSKDSDTRTQPVEMTSMYATIADS